MIQMEEKGLFREEREKMVREQIAERGIRDPRLLEVMFRVPRHLFLPQELQQYAYKDGPLPIGLGQTISQPYMVASMTDLLGLRGEERVLEIGTGSGYQAAVLSGMAREVHTIERHAPHAHRAASLLEELGYRNVQVHIADGSLGWQPGAPYHAIVVTAAAPRIPSPLLEQLVEGGRLVIPVGTHEGQVLERWRKEGGQARRETLYPVAFVPLRGELGWQEQDWQDEEK